MSSDDGASESSPMPEIDADLLRCRDENLRLRDAHDVVEKALSRATRLYQFAPVACAEVDARGAVLSVNASFEALLGLSAAELSGRSVASPLGPALARVVDAALTLEPGATADAVGALRTVGGDRQVRLSAAAVGGHPPTALLAVEDQADQIAADLALAASRRRYRGVFLSASDAILLFDGSGRCREANPAAYLHFGWDAGSALPTWSELMPPDLRALAAESRTEGRTLAPFATEVTLQTPTGPRSFEFRIAAIDADTWQAVLRDLTDFKATRALESRLRQAEKMDALGRLAGGIVHDMNNVLAATANYAALIAESTTDEVAAADARSILGACTRGKQITGNLLRFTRGAPEVRVRADLRRVVEEAMEILRHSIPKTVEIGFALPPTPVIAMVDGAQLIQVLLNLMMNSAQAMPDGGRIQVRLRTSHGQALLDVEDTGPGIPPDILPRVMEPFFTTKPAGKGTGLGLSIAYGVIRSHLGTIALESEPGRGTTVAIALPLGASAPVTLPPATASSPSAQGAALLSGRRVLVVDDEPEFRRGLERILGGMGIGVAATGDAATVIDRWRAEPYDAIVLDLDMPGIEGVTVLQRLLAIDPEARVLIAGGYGRECVADSLLELPRVRYLRKPFLPGELGTTLAELLAA